MAEHRREADVPLAGEDRQDDAPVVEVGDRALAQVGIVEQDHVALADVAAEPLDDARDVGAELADDHPAVAVADHRELVVLLADHRRHRGAPDDLVHLEADVQQRVLDEVQGGAVDRHAALLGLISRLACSSTVGDVALQDDGRRVVLLDHGRAVDDHARCEPGAVVGRDVAVRRAVPDRVRAGPRARRVGRPRGRGGVSIDGTLPMPTARRVTSSAPPGRPKP